MTDADFEADRLAELDQTLSAIARSAETQARITGLIQSIQSQLLAKGRQATENGVPILSGIVRIALAKNLQGR